MVKNIKRIYFGLLIIAFTFSSCNKQYQYIEVTEDLSINGTKEIQEKEPKYLTAANDSTAYIRAYEKFCISLQVHKDVYKSIGTAYSTPLRFKLLNSDGEDITNSVNFSDKIKIENEIQKSISSIGNTTQESETTKTFIDSVKVKELKKYFNIEKDEFSNNELISYKPKNAPQYINRNGIYLYFKTENGVPASLRFKFQYYADEWLFFSKLQFSVDGKAYQFIPYDTETDSGNGGYIWEWFDESLTEIDKELIYAISNAKNAKIEIIGSQYYDTKIISQDQIESFKHTLELYKALGGKY